jgi:hypothetical protein
MKKQLTFWKTHKEERSLFTEVKRLTERYAQPGKCGEEGLKYRKKVSGRHSLPGEHIRRDKSGRIRASKGHSLPGECIGRDKSAHGKNPSERGALTIWRVNREGQVRTRKASERVRGTHFLESTSGGISQDTERIQASKGHSRAGKRSERASNKNIVE